MCFFLVLLKKFEIVDLNLKITSYFSLNICFFFIQFSMYTHTQCAGGLKWTRTTDLTLIRRAL